MCPSLLQVVHVRGRQFNSRQPSTLNKLAINQEMFSGSVDACFVLALPFHHGDLEPDCVGVSSMTGAYARDKNTSARLCSKNAGGLCTRGGVFVGHYSSSNCMLLCFSHRTRAAWANTVIISSMALLMTLL